MSVEVAWTDDPTNAEDITYLSGKVITGATLDGKGNVKITSSSSALTSNNDDADNKIYIKVIPSYVDGDDVDDDPDHWEYAVTFWNDSACSTSEVTDIGVRIATNNHNGPEYQTGATELAPLFGQTEDNESPNTTTNPYHTADGLEIPGNVALTVANPTI